ncbi:MAG TPA: DUF3017 domain-containing protein [Streptosporangiaceae bacterium]|nr:DUF3017 domain-containing protein [Streptosporangiaceae bacterium]
MSPVRVLAGNGRHGARRRDRDAGQQPQTARPPEAERGRSSQWPYLAVLAGVAIALLIIGQGVHLVRSGTLVFAGVLLAAALARLVLPERLTGMLSSRRRLLDVAIFGVLGIGLLAAGLVVPVPG